jgi:hypothetical protein
VYLRVLPMKGVKRSGVKGKLAFRYIGLFPILEKCGTVAATVFLTMHFGSLNEILASLVCILKIVRFEFQIQTLFFLFKPSLFGTSFVTRILTYKCAQLNSLL